jgi:hypothetical protein
MPTFATGNAQWDQNLSTLGNALFPDPSKAGEAFYYGAKAREAQVDTSKKMDQMAAGHTALGMQFGNRPNPTFQTGPGNVPVMVDPGASGAAPLPPPLMTPNMGPTVSGTAGSAPGPGFGPGMPQPVLGGPGGPPAGPAAVAQTVATGVQAHDYAAPGTERTTTDGQRPQSGYPGALSGAFTDPNGGTKMAGKAAADGSPSPVAFNLSQYMALQALSGLGADQMRVSGQAMVANWVKNGQMDARTADNILAGLGVPTLRETNLREAGAITRTGMEQSGATTRTGMEQSGAMARTKEEVAGRADVARIGLPPQTYITPGKPEEQTTIPGAALPPTGRVGMTPAAAAEATKVDNFIDPKNPTVLIPENVADAQRKGHVAVPKSLEGWNALAAYATVNQPPDQAQRTRDAIMQLATATNAKPVDAQEALNRGVVRDQRLAQHIPVPASAGFGAPTLTAQNQLPSGAGPELDPVLSNLAHQYFIYGPREAREDFATATDMAIAQLIRQKYINPNQDRTMARPYVGGGTTVVNKPTLGGGSAEHFRIELMNPETGQPYDAGKAPATVPMDRSISSTPGLTAPFERVPGPTAPATAAAPAGSAAARVPPGTPAGPAPGLPEGHTGTNGPGGQVFVVQNGQWVAR